jgi:long-chain acyl-CoA synthetase
VRVIKGEFMTIKYKVDEKRPFFGKFWPEGVPKQLDYDYSMSLVDLFDSAVRNWADDPSVWFMYTLISYKELKRKIDGLATAMHEMGVKKGDVVAIHLPNCPQYVVAYYAIATLGAIVTGVNPTYKPLEILHQMKVTKAKYIVVLDALYEHYVKKFKDDWNFEKIIYTNLVDDASEIPEEVVELGIGSGEIPSADVTEPNAVAYKDCIKTEPNVPKIAIDPEKDTAVLMMTGGTTGVPKAAVLTHENVVSNAKQCCDILLNQKEPGDENTVGHRTGMLGVIPLYHSFAMTTVMNCSIAVGGWQLLYAKPPDAEELIQDIEDLPDTYPEYNGIIYCAAEILFQRITELADEDFKKYDIAGRIKLCISGAGPLHEYVRIPYEAKTGAKITEGYGLSEASPVVSANNFYGEREPGWIGVPAPGTDWDIFPSEDFSQGPVNEIGEEKGTGEICVCGPQVMAGYLDNPERTAATIKEWDGRKWLLTGDIGYMDEHGRIKIRDRKKQLIKMAGHSVFPKEVENLIGTHPKVLEVAVAGLPDAKTGEAVKAWVVLKPEDKGTITAEELRAWSLENITRWKAPKYVELIEEIPKSMVGKAMRRTLQEADPLWKGK